MDPKSQVRRVLEYALEREHQGMAFFQENASRLNHPAARGIFEQLVEEETKHARYIQNLLDGLEETGEVAVSASLADEINLFSDRAELEQLDQTVYESMVPDVTVLRMAYLIERDFAEFYAQAAARSEGVVKTALEQLARWEEGHEELFKHLHDTLFDAYMKMPWGG